LGACETIVSGIGTALASTTLSLIGAVDFLKILGERLFSDPVIFRHF